MLVVLTVTGCSNSSTPGSNFVPGQSGVTIIPEEDRRLPDGQIRGPSVRDHPEELVVPASGPVVLNVWASWCGPCRAEVDDLEEAADLRPEVLFVGIDGKETSPENGQAFQRSNNVSYDSIYDPDGSVLVAAGIFPTSYFPSTAVLDGRGRVAAIIIGEVDSTTLVGVLDDVG